MARQPNNSEKEEKPEAGSGMFESLTALFPYPMRWVGSAVFLFTCAGCVFYLVISGLLLSPEFSSNDASEISYYNFETVELLLRIAAVALVLAALSGERNSIVVVLGLLLVGALIVPTKDMMRLYLAATDSNRHISDFYGDSGGGPELRGRDAQLASTIVDVLHQADVLTIDNTTIRRADLYWLVAEEISHERVTTLLERARARGALGILAEIQNERVAQTSYRYGDDDRHLATLRFLRNASLITYVYDDFDTIEVTDLGLRVLHRARNDGFSAGRLITSSVDEGSLYEDCLPRGFNEPHRFILDGELPADAVWGAHQTRLGRHPEYAVLQVATEDSVSVNVWARSSNLKGEERGNTKPGQAETDASVSEVYARETLDDDQQDATPNNLPEPRIQLFDVNGEGGCVVVGSASVPDTETGATTIGTTLSPGHYVVRLEDVRQTRGRVVLSIASSDFRIQEEDAIPGFDISFEDFDRSLFDDFREDASCRDFAGSDPTTIPLSDSDSYGPETVDLQTNNPTLRRFAVSEGAYEITLNGNTASVDPYLYAQFIPSEESCTDVGGWDSDDDDGDGLNSRLEIDATSDGELFVSLTAFDEFSSGTARFSLAKTR